MSTWRLEDAEAHLLSLELFGMRFGLERMRRLLTVLGSPQERFRAIHVVGTNGKSSTARMCAALLEAHGVRTGTFLSPHLSSFAERIRIGDADLGPDAFGAAVQRAAAAAAKVDRTLEEDDDRVTQFELLAAAAFAEFARQGVEVAVVEAGLGGRHDATNVLGAPVVVLTNVGLEHTRWLGPTVPDIAREKLAVVRRGATLVTGPLDPEVRELAALTGAEVVPAPPVVAGPAGYQRGNFAVAVAAVRASHGELEPALVAEVAARVQVPGRMQVVAEAPLTIYDGAHNPSGMAALVEALDVGARPLIAVVSILDDKDAAGMLRALLGKTAGAVFTRSRNPRALSPATLASLAEQLGGPASEIVADPHAAVDRARELAGPTARSWPPARSTSWPTCWASRGAGGRPRCERSRAQPVRHGGGRGGGRGARHPDLLRHRVRPRSGFPVTPPSTIREAMPYFGIFGITNDSLNTAVNVLLLVLVVVWLALIFWTYADARRRIDDPMLVACATAASLFPFVGTIVYLIVRPPEFVDDVRLRELEMTAAEARLAQLDYQLCPHCDYEIKADYLRCPSCMRKLKERCYSCSKPVDPAWKLCPFCEAEMETPPPPQATRRRRRSQTTDQPTVAAEAIEPETTSARERR